MNRILKIKKQKYASMREYRDSLRNKVGTEVNTNTDKLNEVFVTCPKCNSLELKKEIKQAYNVCPKCNHYYSMSARSRIRMLLDPKSGKELKDVDDTFVNPINFPGYKEKYEAAREKTELNEAVITVVGKIEGYRCVLAVMDSRFLMASMGSVVGEKITSAIEYADKKKLPLIIYSASGGARMQEGMFSLMQMAKTSAALERFSENGGLYISVLTNPTTGGVTASFASLGDITLAEPKALIGFAGPRVIEQTIGEKLPEGFQSAEFQLEQGFVDMIVERKNQREVLKKLLMLHSKRGN